MRKGPKGWHCLFCTLFLSGCALLPVEEEGRSIALVPEQQAPDYAVEEVQYRDLQSTETLYATYGYMGNESYRFEVSGVLGNVYVSQGDMVEQGQILACLDTYEDAKADADEYTGEIERLSGEQERLRTQMEFKERYVDIKHRYGEMTDVEYAVEMRNIDREYGIALQEIEDELYIDRLLLEEAQKCAEEGVIVAERDGIVSDVLEKAEFSWESIRQFEAVYGADAWKEMERMQERVNAITPDTNIVSVADLGACAFACETEYTGHFQINDHVTITMGENTEYSVVVTDIKEHTVYFQLTKPDQSISVGATGRYTLVFDGREHVLSILASSLHEMEGGYYVYYVDETGLRQMKTVEVGVIGNVYAEITGGLEEGDLVIKR